MKRTASDSSDDTRRRELRVDGLLGRQVFAANNQRVGRLEEFRTEKRGRDVVIAEYVIGGAGLLERLGVGIKLLFGRRGGGYVARWNQLDIRDPERPRLTCRVDELDKL
jgi:hypothetical protein